MCVVCVELIKQKMTILEAERNLGELSSVEKNARLARHYQNLYDTIVDGDFDSLDFLMEASDDELARDT